MPMLKRHTYCMRQHLVTFWLALALTVPLSAQREGWTKPFPGHRVIGNLYAVGSYDLGVFLITTGKGHILINTGVEESTAMIRENIESVGFRMEDIEILLTMQSHWDHTAALAEIKEITGAEMWATAADARVLADGGFSDPHFGGKETFKPIGVDRIIKDGEVIKLGKTRLTVVETPGHTEGSLELHHEGARGPTRLRCGDREHGHDQQGKEAVGRPEPIPEWRTISPRPFASRRR